MGFGSSLRCHAAIIPRPMKREVGRRGHIWLLYCERRYAMYTKITENDSDVSPSPYALTAVREVGGVCIIPTVNAAIAIPKNTVAIRIKERFSGDASSRSRTIV